jgi:hypothetical protein
MSHDPQSPSDAADFDDDDGEYDDGLDDDGNFPFECPAYWPNGQWVCPLAGTEECDWECQE